jgi:hypothetical protein
VSAEARYHRCSLVHDKRIHLTRWAVTAPAEKHRSQDHRPGLPGPRRPQLVGDANDMRICV